MAGDPLHVIRIALALLAIAAVVAGCGARSEGGADASGILVFSGLGSGSYLHSIRPDGSGLRGVELPENCSPRSFESPPAFTRDGSMLGCDEWDDPWGSYAALRDDGEWRRVPLPAEMKFPKWTVDPRGSVVIDAPEWAPAGDRIVFIRKADDEDRDDPYGEWWFSAAGQVVTADSAGEQERVVADDGQVPTWSPDGTRLAFARCRVSRVDPSDEDAEDTAECSLWLGFVDEPKRPEKLVDATNSAPVWSPDGQFVAFFRETGACSPVCRTRIFVASAKGGEAKPVGPELIQPSELLWLPESASAVVGTPRETNDDDLERQRCVDIWNRARMQWPNTVANARLVKGACQITVAAYRNVGVRNAGGMSTAFACWQPVPHSFECPSHGGTLPHMNPDQRVWNAYTDAGGKLALVRPPKGERLPLPKFPPYPILDGWILPFDSEGKVRQGLTISEKKTGTCSDGWLVDHPDSVRCSWEGKEYSWLHNYCFKPPGPIEVADFALCGDSAGATSFLQLKLSTSGEPLD